MATQLSPGVVVTELDLSLYAPAISTTIVGIVGTSTRGPLDSPVAVTNENQLINTFGIPSAEHKALYCARQYLKFGNQCVFVRVAGDNADHIDLVDSTGVDTVRISAVETGSTFEDISIVVSEGSALGGSIQINVLFKGVVVETIDNLDTKAEVIEMVNEESAFVQAEDINDAVTTLPEIRTNVALEMGTGVIADFVIGNSITIANDESTPKTMTANVRAVDAIAGRWIVTLGNIAFGTGTTEVPISIAGGTPIVATATTNNSEGIAFSSESVEWAEASPVLKDGSPAYAYCDADDGELMVLTGPAIGTAGPFAEGDEVSFGGGGTATVVSVTGVLRAQRIVVNNLGGTLNFSDTMIKTDCVSQVLDIKETSSLRLVGNTAGSWANGDCRVLFEAGSDVGSFRILVYYRGDVVEKHDNLVMTPATSEDYVETVVNASSTYITAVHNPDNDRQPTFAGPFGLQGGTDGGAGVVQDGDYIGTVINGVRTGLKTLANNEELDLNLLTVPGVSHAAVLYEMETVCRTRGDTMAVFDCPFGLDRDGIIAWHNGEGGGDKDPAQALNTSYAALYWPWVQVYDAYNEIEVWIPPSGHILGVCAHTDNVSECWFAPAGLNRGMLRDVLRLEPQARTTLGDREFLYAGGRRGRINPLVNFRGIGITVWGQRTLQVKPTALDRVNVRRLLLYLRKVVASTLLYLTFEPNDPETWRWFVNLVTPIMQSVQSRRGVRQYSVVCDESTNTPDIVEQNHMLGKIFLVPTKVAEVIEVQFVIQPQGATFTEA